MEGVIGAIAEISRGVQFGGTADGPGTAQTDVASLADVVGLEVAHVDDGVVEGVVVVPLVAAAVEEDDDVGEGEVAVDDVSRSVRLERKQEYTRERESIRQIDHGFIASIGGNRQLGLARRSIGAIDIGRPLRHGLLHPRHITVAHGREDQFPTEGSIGVIL